MNAYLITEDGSRYPGVHAGSTRESISVLCPHTAAVGYTGILSDPASGGQMLMMTYPLIGNSGVNKKDMESERIHADALIVRELSRIPSNFRSEMFLQDFLMEYDVPAITGIDTRALAMRLREEGALRCMVTSEECDISEAVKKIKAYDAPHPVTGASVKQVRFLKPPLSVKENGKTIAVLDFGIRNSLTERMLAKGFCVTLYPYDTKAEVLLKEDPEKILLSEGPGHPEISESVMQTVSALCASGKEVFGIGLGHQILAISHGLSVSEMRFGHHGSNYPVRERGSGRVMIVSEHCRYVVDGKEGKTNGAAITHVNVNDQTIEGLSYGEKVSGIQYHPGENDEAFERFLTVH